MCLVLHHRVNILGSCGASLVSYATWTSHTGLGSDILSVERRVSGFADPSSRLMFLALLVSDLLHSIEAFVVRATWLHG